MQHRYRLRLRRYAPLAAVALLGTAAAAPPAHGAVANVSHIIEVVANTSDVTIGGLDTADIELRRNGVVIGTGTSLGADGESGLNSDHVPGGCWDGFEPQMLPGDEIHNVTNGDFIELGQVQVTSPITEENGAVVFRGNYTGPLPNLHELDATIDPATEGFRWADGSSGGQFLSAGAGDSGGQLIDHGDGTWTARWTGLTGVEKQQALGGHGAASVGKEHDLPGETTGGEVTAWHFGEDATGNHGGCNTQYRPNEVTGFDRAAINASNAGSAVGVNGVAQPGVTDVLVTLTDRNGATATDSVTPAGDGSWSASIPAGSFADGAVEATVQMTLGGGDFAGVGSSINKDTVAPAAPTASVAPGTYQQVQNVALTGQNVRYTTNGSTPNAGSQAYGGPVSVGQSQTIKAVSVDAAGNLSSVSEFAYTINLPVASPAPGVTPPATVIANTVRIAPRLQLSSLSVLRRMSLRSARRSGVRVVFAANGARAVRLRLRRGNKTIASVTRRVSGNGTLRVNLPLSRKQRRALKAGTYSVQITPGSSTSRLNGVTSTRLITLG